MGHLLLIAVVHLLNPLYVDAFSVRDLLLSLNTCTMYLDLEIAVEVRTSTKKNPCPYNLCIHDYVKNQGRNI